MEIIKKKQERHILFRWLGLLSIVEGDLKGTAISYTIKPIVHE